MRLEVDNLNCVRAGRPVFVGVAFALTMGEGLLVRGANGAGKSSLLRILAGLDEANGGRITWSGGTDALPLPHSVHYLAHADAVKTALTVEEHLGFYANLLGRKRYDGGDFGKALDGFDLATLRHTPARYLSAGQKRRLALARLLLIERPLWLLDEPTAVLDQASTARFEEHLAAHCRKGGMVIATTHDALSIPDARTLNLGAIG